MQRAPAPRPLLPPSKHAFLPGPDRPVTPNPAGRGGLDRYVGRGHHSPDVTIFSESDRKRVPSGVISGSHLGYGTGWGDIQKLTDR